MIKREAKVLDKGIVDYIQSLGEPQIVLDFNTFLEKWTGNAFPHLIDDDENDGERFREKLRELTENSKDVKEGK